MDGRRLLLIVVISGLLVGAAVGEYASPGFASPKPGCGSMGFYTRYCSVHGARSGRDVKLFGDAEGGGRTGMPQGGGMSWIHNGAPTGPGSICDEKKMHEPCLPRTAGRGPVSIHDMAEFRPRPGSDHMQPNGWAIVGLDTNFFATAPSELERGELLGQPAEVRFVPVSWRWRYGDGMEATVGTPGATWAAQGLSEFDGTRTSHVYAAAGSYFIDLDIRFGAEYRYAGSGWVPVEGTIDVPAKRLVATAGGARTVLVNHDCLANPHGPGC
jgi:hypothetical protein